MCDQFGFSEACASSASGEKEYRIVWRNIITGAKWAGVWHKESQVSKESKQCQSFVDNMNRRYPELERWVEEREAEPKEEK